MKPDSAILLVCPACKQALQREDDFFRCNSCERTYPIYQGIPDLRFPPTPLDERDRAMLAVFETADFEQLFEILIRGAELPETVMQTTYSYYGNQVRRSEMMTGMLLDRAARVFGEPSSFSALDVGCGAGAALIALDRRFDRIAGIDASLAQLLMARKNLDQHGLGMVPLICAFAGSLPFPDAHFSYIQAINVLEHVLELAGPVEEVHRCLADGGLFAADSRNRFDIFMPEPHTGIRFLGFLPRHRIPGFVRWLRDSQYESTWLFSYTDLRSAFRKKFGNRIRIVFPRVAAYGQPAWMDRLIAVLERIPLIRLVVLQVFSAHIVLGYRAENK